jgi:hypothetical protein
MKVREKSTKKQRQVNADRRRERALLLEPNQDSDLKVEIYTFGLTKKFVLGVPATLYLWNYPDVNFRPSKIAANADRPGMFYVRDLRIANVSATVGGSIDAFNLKDMRFDLPTMTPANKMTAIVEYTGLVPESLKAMPKSTPTVAQVFEQIEEALDGRDDRVLRETLKALIDRGPRFEFVISTSGYATIVA